MNQAEEKSYYLVGAQNINANIRLLATVFIALTAIFYYYLGEARIVAFVAYFVAAVFAVSAYRHEKIDRWIFLLLALLVVYHAVADEHLTSLLLLLRLNFGFLVFYYFFRSIERLPRLGSLATILSLATIIEYLLIRVHPHLIEILPNYMDGTFVPANAGTLLAGVHGFGGNRTVTSVSLLALFVYLEEAERKRRFRYLPLIASALCFSGTAATLTVAYFAWRYRKYWPLVLISIAAVFVLTSAGDTQWDKFTTDYLLWMYDHKSAQIVEAVGFLNVKVTWLIFGAGDSSFRAFSKEIVGYGGSYGDFALLGLFSGFGILGLLLVTVVFFASANRYTWPPLLVLLVGTLHYHVVFSMFGQVLLGYFLACGWSRYDAKLNAPTPCLEKRPTVDSNLR